MQITHLTLYTANLNAQTTFYQNKLGLTLLNKTATSAEFSIGETLLKFEASQSSIPYHFAINIPTNKGRDAINWIKERAEVLLFEGQELIDFPDWKAEAVYFYDADHNIVELIARQDTEIFSNLGFKSSHLLNISEIGMAVESIETTYQALNQIRELPIYDGNFDKFCAAGNPQGLFIIVDRKTKHWFPTEQPAQTANFKMRGDYIIEFEDGAVIV